MNKYIFLFVVFGLLAFVSCKSSKTAQKKDPAPTLTAPAVNTQSLLLSQIDASKNVSPYHQATGNLTFKTEKQSQELGVTITMEQGKYIYLNITAVMGIPVARVLATPDSLVMLDMLHRKCIITNYAYVKQLLQTDLGFVQLQQLLLGNPPFTLTEKCIVDSLLGKIVITEQLASSQVQVVHFNAALKVNKTELINRKDQQSFTAEYNKVYNKGSSSIPSSLNINIRAEKNIESTLELTNFVFDKKKELQFTIPKSYEIQRL
ncbi:MAG: DUF4292 domain-containing protein [Bacteroidia bacterium]|jgi:hypothetical protein|nr:DUF4292 domain-containing protein [Bacteroidia bacterium]